MRTTIDLPEMRAEIDTEILIDYPAGGDFS